MKSEKGTILVTGGLGYIGSHTAVLLLEKGYDVLIIDDLSNSSLKVLENIHKISGLRPHFEQLDLKDRSSVQKLFISYPEISSILHFAAYKSVGESVQRPLAYYQNNINGLLHLLEAMSEDTHFVFSSSCTVYGQAAQLPITEDSPIQKAASPYGNTKKICEEILADTLKACVKTKAISLRYFNPIGAHPSGLLGENPKNVPQNLVPYITQSALGKIPPLIVHGDTYPTPDGTCIRDYIHIMDLAEAHIAAMEYLSNVNTQSELIPVNLGTGKGHSVLEVIQRFEAVTGLKLHFTIGPKRDGDVTAAYANIEKAKQLLPWKPQYTLEEAMASAWAWEQKNNSSQHIKKEQL